jgi:uracil-DNA glycosylase
MRFTNLVRQIRAERGPDAQVPGFDPSNGNEHAKYLFLLEAPGPRAVQSGIISLDNPDPTAENFRVQLSRAGITRDEIAIWNIVPWYIGIVAGNGIRAAAAADVQEGMKYLEPLIAAMSNLQCVVLVGGAARRAHMHLSRITTARIVTCHHPSARAHARNQQATNENIELFCHLKQSVF